MPQIKEITVYSYSELSPEAQKKAISNLSDINVDSDWWDATYSDANEIGLKITGFDIDRGSYVKGEFTLSACEVAQNIFNNHGAECETFKTAKSFMDQWQPVFDNYMNESHPDYESGESEDTMQDLESEFLKSLCEDYRIILTHEYDYLTSDKAIIETIEANEYTFTESGKMENL